MNSYVFQADILLRSPAFSYRHFRLYSLQDWLRAPYFLLALSLANKLVYTELSKHQFDVGRLPPKMKRTLFNYINRMHYRCVPFGAFAGFTSIKWQEKGENPIPIVLGDQRHIFLVPDRLEMLQQLGKSLPDNFMAYQYYTNPSFYKGEKELRYLRPELNDDGDGLHYTITTIKPDKVLSWLLGHCTQTTAFTELLRLLMQEAGYNEVLTKDYLYQLIRKGILLPDLQATQVNLANTALQPISINRAAPKDKADIALPDIQSTYYANTRYHVQQGNIALVHQQRIIDGLAACTKLSANHSPGAIRKFKSDFLRKFDQQVVPLLLALDPELGLGYAQLEQEATPSDILEAIALPKRDVTYKEVHWNAVHALLFEKMQARPQTDCSIHLDDSDLDAIRQTAVALPPGMSVLFRIAEGKLFIESCGGPTATALPGRFSLFDKHIRSTTAALARNEINNNPDIIFAEIDSLQEYHVANIELRATFFDYKISIVTNTGNIRAKDIPLSDLWVTVRNDQVILWSESLGKEVIPRLSTAYNMRRSPLTIYRFLCELQYQGIRTHFQLDLSHYFPSLRFYPRVTYKESILSLATWRITVDQLKKIRSYKHRSDQALALQETLKALHCPEVISEGDDDTQLVYNINMPDDLELLLENMAGKEQVTLKEFPFLEAHVTDNDQSPYVSQFLATLTQNKEIFKSNHEDFNALIHLQKKQRTHPNWLYVKLYCHPSKADEQLRSTIFPFIKKHRLKNHFKKWHFIRYADPLFHIRLRFECHDAFGKANIWLQLNELLEPLQAQGIYADIKTDLYKRELERYYPFDINTIEDFFHGDSNWTAELLKQGAYQDELWYAVGSSWLIIGQLFATYKQQSDFAHMAFDAFYTEFHGDKMLLHSLSQKYESYRLRFDTEADTLRRRLQQNTHFQTMKALIQELNHHKLPSKHVVSLCMDLVHMHLNRLFGDSPREKEMVVYYFLWRQYSRLLHIKNR